MHYITHSQRILVVGALIVDDLLAPGRLLAARRSEPSLLAGGWEFPGGKVKAGEEPADALIREAREELGVEIRLGDELEAPDSASWPINTTFEMRLVFARAEGDPQPLEDHDELRWLTPDDLQTVEWLTADRAALPYIFRYGKPNSTPERVTELAPGEIFVFGSNAEGDHGGGAALIAAERFGAEWGVGEGRTGRTYALPTMGGWGEVERSAAHFLDYARENPGLVFYLTKVGCGIAGYDEARVAPLFAAAPPNVIRPASW